MSEAFPGLPPPPEPRPPRPASAVILWRESAGGREVFWVRRGAGLRFAGGFYAFPGGKVDAADAALAVSGAAGAEAASIASACRELFEETGVLLGTARVATATRAELRRELLEGRQTFADVLTATGTSLDAALLTPAGRWITPPFVPVRFDARFYLAELPAGQDAEVWPGELSDGGWIACSEALARWRDGRALLHPPNRWAIEPDTSAPIGAVPTNMSV